MSSSSKHAIIFVPYGPTSWARMQPQIRAVQDLDSAEVLVLLCTPFAVTLVDQCKAADLVYKVLGPIDRQDQGNLLSLKWLQAHLQGLANSERLANSLPAGLLQSYLVRKRLRREFEIFKAFLADNDADLIFIQGDRELGAYPPLIKAANHHRIPVAIATTGSPTSPDGIAKLRAAHIRFALDWKRLPPLLNMLAAWRYPGQVRHCKFGKLLFSPGWLILALGGAGVLSNFPWYQGGGGSDYILLDGETKARKHIEGGIPESKILVVGDIELDPLFQAHQNRLKKRQELLKRYNLNKDRPLCILAVPVFGEHGLMAMSEHMAQFAESCKMLSKHGCNVIFSLHPKSELETYQAIATEFGFVIAEERLSEILPCADFFICGSSTTIEWAVVCGIPTINLDYAGLNDTSFAQLRGVIRVTNANELSELVGRILSDSQFATELVQHHQKAAPQYGSFDGSAGDRLRQFVIETSGRRQAIAGA